MTWRATSTRPDHRLLRPRPEAASQSLAGGGGGGGGGGACGASGPPLIVGGGGGLVGAGLEVGAPW